MTYILRRLALLLTAFGIALPAAATTFSPDFTDLWYNPAESGWGVNVIQQGNTLFATLFVYGTDQTPRWYVASGLVGTSSSSTTGSFTGRLYRTTGPYFGAAWTGVGPVVDVGSMTFAFNTPTTASLNYSIDGVNVSKSIQRQTFVSNNLTGTYQGGMVAQTSACQSGSNGAVLVFNEFSAAQTAASNVSITVRFFTGSTGTASTCTFTGPYTQAGKTGNIAGNWTCSTGNNGTFTISQIDLTPNGWNARFEGRDQFCTYAGFFGGIRDTQ